MRVEMFLLGVLMWQTLSLDLSRAAESEIDFDHQIVPIVRKHCASCHAGAKKQGGLSFNTRADLLAGGESGPVVVPGKSQASELHKRITTADADLRMPPEGPRVSQEEVKLLDRWIDTGLPWTAGFSFQRAAYEPPLRPRQVTLPLAQNGREHPLDRILDAYLSEHQLARPEAIDDAAFLRRASLDLVGLLPEPERLEAFLNDTAGNKRAKLVASLLADDMAYAEHWLTFWNDLLRNDYAGTGFITGGRKQISRWLYGSLVTNKPYDQFVRELVAPPSDESRGFGDGIRWRGEVSAGQSVEIQFAQSVGQVFLGINLKCASCHDSFIDRWKLTDAYSLAAIYSSRPLEIHRCDKPIGEQAAPAWLFPELGQIEAKAPPADRLNQLARLLTSPDNGRLARTIVNRLWHRLMGRGIVHPTDAMQTEPWSADLLDYLAADFVAHGYDLKHSLALIATSQAYQSRVQVVTRETDDRGYVYAGPRAKRMTAEQFVDAVWQLTGAAPTRFDAPVFRGAPRKIPSGTRAAGNRWIWSSADSSQAAAGETVVFRKRFELHKSPTLAIAMISCDNSHTLYVNGQLVEERSDWEQPEPALLTPRLKTGANEIVIVARNGGTGPNPAGLFCEARLLEGDELTLKLAADESWEWTREKPDRKGRFAKEPADWQPAAIVTHPERWNDRLGARIEQGFEQAGRTSKSMVRAALLKNDFLMRSLGRPHREQIVSMRPEELSMLEAVDLSNGQILSNTLTTGAKNLCKKEWRDSDELVDWLYRFALSRPPTADERAAIAAELGEKLTEKNVQDVLWAVLMLPEFQFIR